ncbi:MAG: peptidyl-prolyl cis-trans isomerase [Deltaproteobacteria bacterium]|nr:peptidyl-prolyl cis-trans isomerase [Deltaproteobacteria bacterium]MBW2123557.1 peptidyl-prolyl cis-trans isomerase [Deltaproteobacteria bacterium]
MRRVLFSVGLLVLFTLSGCKRGDIPAHILARVDGKAITLEDFNREFRQMRLENEFSPGGHEALMEMKERFLEQMVEEALILEEARRLGMTVTDEELEAEVMETKSDYKGESLRDYLSSQGLSFETWKKRVKERILIEKTIQTGCHFDGTITTEEARAYYDAHREDYLLPERVRARQIVVASERNAKKILRELKAGKEFEELALENSLGPESAFGGDLGYFARGDMPGEFDVVFSMEKGEISKPVRSPYGYHIFKVEDKVRGRQLTFEEVADDVKRKIARIKSEQLYYQWLEELKKNAKIEINHRLLEYTE